MAVLTTFYPKFPEEIDRLGFSFTVQFNARSISTFIESRPSLSRRQSSYGES